MTNWTENCHVKIQRLYGFNRNIERVFYARDLAE